MNELATQTICPSEYNRMIRHPSPIQFHGGEQSCRELGMIGGISTVQLAVAVWILARASLLFAKAYQIVKETNRKG